MAFCRRTVIGLHRSEPLDARPATVFASLPTRRETKRRKNPLAPWAGKPVLLRSRAHVAPGQTARPMLVSACGLVVKLRLLAALHL